MSAPDMPGVVGIYGARDDGRTHPCNYCPVPIPFGAVCWMIHTKPITTMCNDCHEKEEMQ